MPLIEIRRKTLSREHVIGKIAISEKDHTDMGSITTLTIDQYFKVIVPATVHPACKKRAQRLADRVASEIIRLTDKARSQSNIKNRR